MVYFDNAATTPVPRPVADAMYQVLTEQFGNPSSQYPIGVEMKKPWRAGGPSSPGRWAAAERLYFTSCGTESDNWAIQAALWQNRHEGQTHHHHRRGAQRRAGALQAAGPAGV